jgi:hypothetical protein
VPRPTSWHSDRIILGTFFNGGLRAYDIADPYRPEEVGVFVPPAPRGAPTGVPVFAEPAQVQRPRRSTASCPTITASRSRAPMAPGKDAKPYQVRQLRAIIQKFGLTL